MRSIASRTIFVSSLRHAFDLLRRVRAESASALSAPGKPTPTTTRRTGGGGTWNEPVCGAQSKGGLEHPIFCVGSRRRIHLATWPFFSDARAPCSTARRVMSDWSHVSWQDASPLTDLRAAATAQAPAACSGAGGSLQRPAQTALPAMSARAGASATADGSPTSAHGGSVAARRARRRLDVWQTGRARHVRFQSARGSRARGGMHRRDGAVCCSVSSLAGSCSRVTGSSQGAGPSQLRPWFAAAARLRRRSSLLRACKLNREAEHWNERLPTWSLLPSNASHSTACLCCL